MLVEFFFEVLPKGLEAVEVFFMLTWSMWNSQNKLIFQNASLDASTTVRLAFSLYLIFISAFKGLDKVSGPPSERSRRCQVESSCGLF